MKEIDRELFLLINAANDANGSLAVLAYPAAKYLIFVVPLGIALLWVVGKNLGKRISLILVTSVVIAVALSWVVGLLLPVQRPFLEPIGHNLLAHQPSPSFPPSVRLVVASK